MFEEGDEASASFDVTQTIFQEGSQLYLEIRADSGWINQPGRKFPVVIDPTIEVRPDALASRDTFASSSQPDAYHHALTSLYAGNHATYGNTRSYLWFNLPTLPDGAGITDAKFSLFGLGFAMGWSAISWVISGEIRWEQWIGGVVGGAIITIMRLSER